MCKVRLKMSCLSLMKYHSTFEITYSGFILGEFNFVIISAKITAQNSVRNYFCNFPCFLQISVLPVAAATDSKPGRVEDPLFPQEKTQLRMATNQIRLLRWATRRKDNHFLQKNRISSILTVHVAKNPAFWPCGSQTILVIPAFWPSDSQKPLEIPAFWPCMSQS